MCATLKGVFRATVNELLALYKVYIVIMMKLLESIQNLYIKAHENIFVE